ncbi:MAG: DUF1989 domain-containing protein, partial [Pseudomonadota bacterium]
MPPQPVLREFSNMGFDGSRRSFPGFAAQKQSVTRSLSPREAFRLSLEAGDMVSLHDCASPQRAALLVFDDRGNVTPGHLGLKENATLRMDQFDAGELLGWHAEQGGTPTDAFPAIDVTVEDLCVFRALKPCTVWIARPLQIYELVTGSEAGQLVVSCTPAAQNSAVLPPPLGHVRDEFTVSRGTAQAYEVKPGEVVQIIDVDGQQCSDFMALRADALERGQEYTIDSTATRSMVRGAFPGPGLLDKFFDRDLRPMMKVVQDTCGRHDTFGMACTARGYEERGFPGHVNCSDNISYALDPFGVGRRTAWPAINFFWNTWIDHHSHQLMSEESHSRPGDYVALKALDAMVCVSTACPDDIDPINGWNPTDVHVRIYREDASIRRAVAYREKEDAPMAISQESAFAPETSKLTHHFAPARDLWAPVSFPSTGT